MDPVDLKAKEKEINLVLSEQPRVNLWKLRELALTEGGLVNDTLRRRAWPKLVGLNEVDLVAELDVPPRAATLDKRGSPTADHELRRVRRRVEQRHQPLLIPEYKENEFQPGGPPRADDDASSTSSSRATESNKAKTAPSLDSDQISRDVGRCTWHLLSGTQRMRRMQMNNKHRRRVATLLRQKQRRLGNLINMTLNHDEPTPIKLRYYQGYHDVASIFMSTLSGGTSQAESATGLGLSSAALSRVSTSHFRDAMQDNFMQLQTAIRLVLMPLISYFDPQVHDFLLEVDMEPFFALSWIITWFSHDIRDTDLVKRLFDAFIVSHPLLPLYVTVAMVCHANNRHEILNAEPDFCAVHSILSNLPKNSSMVGWRYQPTGEGYVSGDEDAPEDDESPDIFVDHTPGRSDTTKKSTDPGLERIDDEEASSMVSSAVSGEEGFVKAPFQEIIDMALDFMRSVPPRKILNHLSNQYYADETLQPMLQLAPDVLLLQPYLGGLKSYADKDLTVIAWDDGMLARRKRRRIIAVAVLAVIVASFSSSNKSCDAPPTQHNSNDGGDDDGIFSYQSSNTVRGIAVQLLLLVLVFPVLIASEMLAQIGSNPMLLTGTLLLCLLMLQMAHALHPNKDEEELTKYYLKSKTNTLAVIACGYGPSDENGIAARRRKRRRIIAVAVLSVIVASYYFSSSSKSYNNAPSPLPIHSNDDTSRSNTSIRTTTRRSNQCCKWHPTPVYCKPMRREECNQTFMTSGS